MAGRRAGGRSVALRPAPPRRLPRPGARTLAAALLLVAAGCAARHAESDAVQADAVGASRKRLVVLADRMLDPVSGRYVEHVRVSIDGDRIAQVETGIVPKDAGGVEILSVKTLLPGLIDAHTHLAWNGAPGGDAARATVQAGFTTVRNLGSDGDEDLRLASLDDGPRVLLSGPGLGPRGGVCHQTFGDGAVVDGPEDARRKVREQIEQRKVDLIKVCAGGAVVSSPADGGTVELDPETLRAIVEEAHAHGKKVAAHAQGKDAIRNAVLAGVDSVEHGGGIDRDTALLMKERGVVLVPTLARLDARLEAAKAQNTPAEGLARIQANRQRIFANVRDAAAAGVTIVNGSDATVLPHGRNAEELAALVEAGLSPLEAIRAATTRAAVLLGRPELGCLAPGCAADLLAVDGDPLADIAALRRPQAVVARGVVRRREPAH